MRRLPPAVLPAAHPARGTSVLRPLLAALATAIAGVSPTAASAAPGGLDPTFGAGGKATVDLGGTDRATHLAIDGRGRVLVVGTTDVAGDPDWAVARLTAAGARDATFGANGTVRVVLGQGTTDVGGGIVPLASGQVLVAGSGLSTGDMVIRRLSATGAGESFTSIADFGGTETVDQMIRQPDGRLVVVGSSTLGGGDMTIARFNADATPDTTFGSGGRRRIDLGGDDEAISVARQSDGKLVIVGRGGPRSDLAVVRLDADGANDTSFGSNSVRLVDLGGTDVGTGVAFTGDGRIVVSGATSAVGSGDLAVVRLTTRGALDTSFGGGDGKATFGFGAADEIALAVALQENGKIVLAANGGTGSDLLAVRVLKDGAGLDTTFGSGGVVALSFPGQFEYDGDVAVQADGKIVIAGSTDPFRGGSGDIAVARLLGDPVRTRPHPVITPTASLREPGWLRVSAVGSLTAGGRPITSYRWRVESLTDTKLRFDVDCGTSPVAAFALPAGGAWRVTSDIGDKAGKRSTVRRTVTGEKVPVGSGGAFTCDRPAAADGAPSAADCPRTFGNDFIAVESRSGRKSDCFTITPLPGSGYRAAIKALVSVNGILLPVPANASSEWDSNGNVTLKVVRRLALELGPLVSSNVPFRYHIEPTRGKFHLVDAKPSAKTPRVLGSLKVGGSLSVDLYRYSSKVQVGLELPVPFSFGSGRTAQAGTTLVLDNRNPVKVDGFTATAPDLWLGPLHIQKLHLDYEKSTRSWNGAAKVTLPGSAIALNAAPPPPDFGIHIRNGRFAAAGFGIEFNPPTQPDLFPPFHSVLLTHIGGSIGLDPLRLTGTIGFSAANIVDEDGVLLMAFGTFRNPYVVPEDPGPQLAPLANRRLDRFSLAVGGTAELKVPILGGIPLLEAYGLYEFPDYFEFGGGFHTKIAFVKLDGNIGGFVYPTQRLFNIEAGLKGCLDKVKIKVGPVKVNVSPCLNVGGVISSRGVGVCGLIPVALPFHTVHVPIGLGWRWGSAPKLMVFSCDYGPYRQVSPLAAAGRSRRAGGDAFGVDVAKGTPAALVRVTGSGGAPQVDITDPQGHAMNDDPGVAIVEGTAPNVVLVAFQKPRAGKWTVAAAPGSPAIASVQVSRAQPAANIRATVSGRGAKRVISYRFTAAPGRTVSFLERGTSTGQTLGTVSRTQGRITFTPARGPAGRRRIVAQVVQNGVALKSSVVATFVAPGPARLAAPARLRAVRKAGSISVTWRPVRGAATYELLLRFPDGRQLLRVVRRPKLVLRDPRPESRAVVTVGALDLLGTRGPTRAVTLKARRPGRR